MLSQFAARYKQVTEIVAGAHDDDMDEFDVEAQLRCAERWVKAIFQGDKAREDLFDTTPKQPLDPTGLQLAQWPTMRMTTWEAIPPDVHTWPSVLGDQDVIIVDWREELRERELEQGQTQAG
eukprot:3530979-Rhodomonas_salina.1